MASYSSPRLLAYGEQPASTRLFERVFGDPGIHPYPQVDGAPAEVQETAVIEYNGELVSQVIIYRTTLRVGEGRVEVGSIGGVCTLPEHRGVGLSTRLLEYCTRRLRATGASLLFISGGRGLYTRMGCVPAGRFDSFLLRPDSFSQSTSELGPTVLRPARETDAEACSRIQQSEPAWFQRAPNAFAEHFRKAPKGYFAESWVVESAGTQVAYLILITPWENIANPTAGIRRLFEYAGDRSAVAPALIRLVTRRGLRELEVLVPWQDADLRGRLAGFGLVSGPACLPDHTLRIINFPALMDGLRPYWEPLLDRDLRGILRFEQTGALLAGSGTDQSSLEFEGERLDLSVVEMSRLVFGDTFNENRSLGLHPGPLDLVIRTIFPLPSFFVGLNYR